MQLLQVVQTTMKNESEVHPRDFEGRASSSCQCAATSVGPRRTTKINADKIHHVNPHMPKIFLQGAGHFSALEMKRKWYGTLSCELEGKLELRSKKDENIEK